MRNTFGDEKMFATVLAADKRKVEYAIEHINHWLEGNQLADLDEFHDNMRKLESICNPVIAKIYQANGEMELKEEIKFYEGDETDMNGATQENVPNKEIIKICGGADCFMVGATQEDEKYREIKNKAQEAENKIGAKNTLKKHVYYMRYKIRDVKNNFLTKILCSAE